VDDLARLFEGIPLDRVSTSMTINATAPVLLAMYVVVGEEHGVPRGKLQGTVQNDILKEFIARGTYIYPIEPSLRLATDVCRFVTSEGMSFNPISVSGYHMREAGATAAQELAFTFANGLEYVRRALAAGWTSINSRRGLSFFFAAFTDLFEEVAKFRAARRLWARLMKENFQATDAACRLRFHTPTGGSTLTAQQPKNNVVRVAIQALAAVLGGTQSLHTNAYDEALALPTEQSATLALRTQQILAHETGIPETVDPAGGSWYVEALTDRVEREARGLLEEIERAGGAGTGDRAGAVSGRDRAQRVRAAARHRVGGQRGGGVERVRGRSGGPIGAGARLHGVGGGAAAESRGAARETGSGNGEADPGAARGCGARRASPADGANHRGRAGARDGRGDFGRAAEGVGGVQAGVRGGTCRNNRIAAG